MGLLKSIFTWWDGATIGTSLWSARNGARVGQDRLGNIYFESKKADQTGRKRRWVIYDGPNDASRVPPEWHGWLHNTVDSLPDESLPPPRIWEKEAAPLKGVAVLVQHKAFTYLIAWLGLKEVAALEPKPGIEPTTAHLSEVLAITQRQPVKMVLHAAYQSDRASQWIAERAKINAVVLPFTVGGDDAAKDLYGLFDDTVARLLKGAQ